MHRNLEGWECGVWQRMSLHFLGRVLHQPQPVPGQVDGASERVLASGGHIAQTGLGVDQTDVRERPQSVGLCHMLYLAHMEFF